MAMMETIRKRRRRQKEKDWRPSEKQKKGERKNTGKWRRRERR